MSALNRLLQVNVQWVLVASCLTLGFLAVEATPPGLAQPAFADGESCDTENPCPEGSHCCAGSCCPDDYYCCYNVDAQADVCQECPCE